MAEKTPVKVDEIDWEQSALEYSRRLTMEHYMESIPQSTQRKIFDAALDIVRVKRPDIHPFGELLVQWVRNGRSRTVKVVPDNMVVLHDGPILAKTSYIIPKQPKKPFWVLEYLSKSNERKDYEESYLKYEKDLKVPYYLIFHPEHQEVTLYRHDGESYVELEPGASGRLAIPELEMEMGLVGDKLRFWFREKLLPMPAEMMEALDQTEQKLETRTKERDDALSELERLRQELARLKGGQP